MSKKLTYIKRLNEFRNQLEIPFDGKHPLKDKPVHVHIIDALKYLASKNHITYLSGAHSGKDYLTDENYEAACDWMDKNQEYDDYQIAYDFCSRSHGDPDIFLEEFLDEDAHSLTDSLIEGYEDILTEKGAEMYNNAKKSEFKGIVNGNFEDVINDCDDLLNVYRAINYHFEPTIEKEAKDLFEQITKEYGGVGSYWSWEEGAEHPHNGYNPNGEEFSLYGRVSLDDIDWVATIGKNAWNLKEEKEIQINNTASVEIYGIKHIKSGKFVPISPALIVPVGK